MENTNIRSVFMGVVVALISLLFVTNIAYADHTDLLYSDGFESADTSAWTHADGWDVVGDDAFEGEFKGRASNPFEGDPDILVQEVSTLDYEDVTLSFAHKESDLEPDDSMLVQIWTGGEEWQTVAEFTDGNESLDWSTTTLSLEADNNSAFMFRFVSHLDSEEDLFHLDSVVLTGVPIDDPLQVVNVFIFDDESFVEVDLEDTVMSFTLDTTDRDEIIDEVMERLDRINLSFEFFEKGDPGFPGSDDDNGDTSDPSGAIQSINLYIYDEHTSVEVDTDETFTWYKFDTHDKDEIVERLADRLDLSESEVKDLLMVEEGSFRDDDDGDDEEVDGARLQQITLTIWDSSAGAEVDTDETTEYLRFDTTEFEAILAELSDHLGISESSVEDVLVIED